MRVIIAHFVFTYDLFKNMLLMNAVMHFSLCGKNVCLSIVSASFPNNKRRYLCLEWPG